MIEMEDIVKTYGNVTALNEVSFQIKRGEIHALLGENGAGKSTLMKVLYGMTIPDRGKIVIEGKTVGIKNPMQAIRLGIGMVHQHFMLAEAMSVIDNIIAGEEPKNKNKIDYGCAKTQIEEMIKRFRFSLKPDTKVADLTVGEKQQVEILKVLYRSAEVLILDEPTAVLSPSEVEGLFEVLRELRSQGKSCIIITHKLYEVVQIADRITVMRDGVVTGKVGNQEISQISVDQLAEYMVGRTIQLKRKERQVGTGEVCLEVKNLNFSAAGRKILDQINFSIKEGEILGVAGVEGNGQSELLQALTGLLRPDSMELLLDGNIVSGDARAFIDHGIGHVPEDRLKYAVAEEMSIADNIVLGYQNDRQFSHRGWMNHKNIKKVCEERIRKYKIKTSGTETKIRQLSGGNQQKVVIARVFAQNPRCMICAQLTRGVDIGASEYFYSELRKFRDDGNAVLLVSSDLQEVMMLSDTIAVMYKGRIVGQKPAASFTQEAIGKLMAGGKETSGQEEEYETGK